MAGLRKLRQWQDLGHEVIFLIGDFTGMIGDPSGKDKARKPLTKQQIEKNAKGYQKQASKLLNFAGKNPVKIKYNSQWLSKIPISEFLVLTTQVTYQQIIERDMFQRRKAQNKQIALSELLYPILQGFDSVEMAVDVEIGGSDQLFNMMMGRDLMHKLKRKNKFVITTPLIVDAQGQKIGKTTGNVIAIADPPEKLFGGIMSLPDDVIIQCLETLTDIPMEEVGKIKNEMKKGKNPMIFKKKLAFEIVKQLNPLKDAQRAQEEFESVIQKKLMPFQIPTVKSSGATISEILIDSGLSGSMSESKRLVQQGAVSGTVSQDAPFERISDPKQSFTGDMIVKKGINIVKIEKGE